MKRLFIKFFVTAIIVSIFFFIGKTSFGVVPVLDKPELLKKEEATYSCLYKELEEYCKGFYDDKSVVKLSVKLVEGATLVDAIISDNVISLELFVDDESKFLFFDSLMDDENGKKELEDNLKLWILADEYVGGCSDERMREILSLAIDMKKSTLFYDIRKELVEY